MEVEQTPFTQYESALEGLYQRRSIEVSTADDLRLFLPHFKDNEFRTLIGQPTARIAIPPIKLDDVVHVVEIKKKQTPAGCWQVSYVKCTRFGVQELCFDAAEEYALSHWPMELKTARVAGATLVIASLPEDTSIMPLKIYLAGSNCGIMPKPLHEIIEKNVKYWTVEQLKGEEVFADRNELYQIIHACLYCGSQIPDPKSEGVTPHACNYRFINWIYKQLGWGSFLPSDMHRLAQHTTGVEVPPLPGVGQLQGLQKALHNAGLL